MHSRDVIWKIKPKSTFPVSFSLVSAEMNLLGNYRTLRGLRTVNPEGLPSTTPNHPIQHPTYSKRTPMTPVGLVMAGCWQINDILSNIGRTILVHSNFKPVPLLLRYINTSPAPYHQIGHMPLYLQYLRRAAFTMQRTISRYLLHVLHVSI